MALAIFAVSIMLIGGVYQVLMKVQNKMEVPNYVEWHLMVSQVDTHLQGYAKPKYDFDSKFYDGRPIKEPVYRIEAVAEHDGIKSVVKISKSGGYHPVLVGYEKIMIDKIKGGVLLKGTLRDHEVFETRFIPGNRVILIEKEIIQEEKDVSTKEETKKEENP